MKAINFEEVNVLIAEDQPQYETLPAYYNQNEGSITSCFELTEEELEEVKRTGKIYYKQMLFGNPMQPMSLATNLDNLAGEKIESKNGE